MGNVGYDGSEVTLSEALPYHALVLTLLACGSGRFVGNPSVTGFMEELPVNQAGRVAPPCSRMKLISFVASGDDHSAATAEFALLRKSEGKHELRFRLFLPRQVATGRTRFATPLNFNCVVRALTAFC